MLAMKVESNATIELSAADVVDHMLARACKYPMVALLLLSKRLANLGFVLHKAEGNKGVEA